MAYIQWGIVAAAATVIVYACTVLQPNPERTVCFDRCVPAKNACMVRASTAEEVSKCSSEFAACNETCGKIPPYLPPPK
jgi:hypothetical protein